MTWSPGAHLTHPSPGNQPASAVGHPISLCLFKTKCARWLFQEVGASSNPHRESGRYTLRPPCHSSAPPFAVTATDPELQAPPRALGASLPLRTPCATSEMEAALSSQLGECIPATKAQGAGG